MQNGAFNGAPEMTASGDNSTENEVQYLISSGSQQQGRKRDKDRFRLATFDILMNPLRADHPFGK
ncbi:MAG: hypothetical protein ACMG6E_09880 [Candidatus Roizmanbacteria bacterium]